MHGPEPTATGALDAGQAVKKTTWIEAMFLGGEEVEYEHHRSGNEGARKH